MAYFSELVRKEVQRMQKSRYGLQEPATSDDGGDPVVSEAIGATAYRATLGRWVRKATPESAPQGGGLDTRTVSLTLAVTVTTDLATADAVTPADVERLGHAGACLSSPMAAGLLSDPAADDDASGDGDMCEIIVHSVDCSAAEESKAFPKHFTLACSCRVGCLCSAASLLNQ